MKRTVSLFAGIAVGVCIGLLIAPAKGSESRRKLADSVNDWAEKFKAFFGATDDKNTHRSNPKTSRTTVARSPRKPKPRGAG